MIGRWVDVRIVASAYECNLLVPIYPQLSQEKLQLKIIAPK